MESTRGNFVISTDRARMDIAYIHHFLSVKSYWSQGIAVEKVITAANNSLNFGVFLNAQQIGYARVVSDFSTIAYLGDLFIDENHRGKGLASWLLKTTMAHPDLQGLKRWILLTRDAHKLYQKYGWTPVSQPEKWMEQYNPSFSHTSQNGIII